ncbi:cytospin-A-like isoform X2 [Antedon mediterranea]
MSQTDLNTAGWTEINELLQQTQQENMAMRQQLELLKQENRNLKDKITALDSSMQYSKTDYEKAMLLALEGSSRLHGESPTLPTEQDGTTLERMPSEGSLVNELFLLPFMPSSSSDGGSILADDPSNTSDNNWDIVSSEGEGSVACLQDRILQMEENHYTVNEELQATLQELTDLQENNNFLSLDNDKLNEEKVLLFELLCQQMEKLQRLEKSIEHFNNFIKENEIEYDSKSTDDKSKGKDETYKQVTELVEANKTSVEGQKFLATLIDQRDTRNNYAKLQDKLLETEQVNEELINEKEKIERDMDHFNELLINAEENLNKVKVQLVDEKMKSADLVQFQDPDGTLNLEKLIEHAASEKELIENRCIMLEKELETSKEETEQLHEQLEKYEQMYENERHEELSAMKETIDELECEKQELETEIINLKDAIEEMDEESERHKADTQLHLQTISDLNKSLQNVKQEKQDLNRNLNELKRTSTMAADEWKTFQKDLQLAVVIANDYRSEAQISNEKLVKERLELFDKINSLEQEVERLKKVPRQLPVPVQVKAQPPPTESEIRKRMQAYMKPADKELAQLWHGNAGRKNTPPLSVKSLVRSIENVSSQNGTHPPVSPSPLTEPDILAQTPSNGSSGRSSPAFSSRPALERRNTAVVSTKTESKTPPPLLRRASTPLMSPNETRKSLSPSAISRTPTTRTDARQAIGDVLYRRADFPNRKNSTSNSSPTNTSTKDSNGIKTSAVISQRRQNEAPEKKDPLTALVRHEGGGSKRNALLRWCQSKTQGYTNIDITNFSSSWNDGLGFCALIHSHVPHLLPYHELNSIDKRRNFTAAFKAAESVGIPSILDVEDMVKMERPDWQSVMTYITSIYTHFET